MGKKQAKEALITMIIYILLMVWMGLEGYWAGQKELNHVKAELVQAQKDKALLTKVIVNQ